MENKVLLLTGGASGIGAATAKHFASLGCKRMALVDIDGQRLKAVAEECEKRGADRVVALEVDLGDERATKGVVGRVVDELGSLDVLVSNAGTLSRHGVAFRLDPVETAKRVMDVNFFAGYILAQQAMPYLQKTKGNIVFVSSQLSKISFVISLVLEAEFTRSFLL